jgi:uncharacterized protein
MTRSDRAAAVDVARPLKKESSPRFSLPLQDSKLPKEILDDIVRRVNEVAQSDRIILFGSAARGKMTPDSDVDLLVIKSGVEHRGHLEEKIYMNFFGLTVSVDVIVVTPEDIERYRGSVGSIIGPALAEGIEIYAA